MKPWYATNARDLLQARTEGLMPDGPVVVTLVGGDFDDTAATTLYAHADMPVDRMDWRMLVNLDVWLVASSQAALSWVIATAVRIANARPRHLVLRFADGDTVHDVEIGTGLHLPAVQDTPAHHAFDWTPINCAGSLVGAKLRRALMGVIPARTVL